MIAIKDMKMSKSCFQCDFYSNEYGCKLKFTEECNPSVEKPDDCPLVEIITCKECKHCHQLTKAPNVWLCEKHNCVSPNFYCADAERRE